MKIEIMNFKNIESLTLDVPDNKVSFLFGISGAGKSSIVDAIRYIDDAKKIMVGKAIEDLVLRINEKSINPDDYMIFDESSLETLLIKKTNQNGIYEILFDEDKKIKIVKDKFEKLVIDLSKFVVVVSSHMEKLSRFSSSFGSSLTKKNELNGKTCKLTRFGKSIGKISNLEKLEKYKKIDSAKLDWIIKGIKSIELKNGQECPFCEQQISDERIVELKDISNIDVKSLDIEGISADEYIQVGLEKPNLLNDKEIESTKNSLRDFLILLDDFSELKKFLMLVDNDDFEISTLKIPGLSEPFLNKFPEIEKVLLDMEVNLVEIKSVIGQVRSTFASTIGKNIKDINNRIDYLGIPYEFQKSTLNHTSRTADFILKHKRDVEKEDRTDCLSYGEKNILALLFFLLQKNDKTLLIDDPASSFDEYRRKVIFDTIYEFQKNRTVVVLSHDHVFAKFAVFSKETIGLGSQQKLKKKFVENSGVIYYLENYSGKATFIEITKNDFIPIECAIAEKLRRCTSYYQQVVNLRLLAELKKYENNDETKIVYGYLSAIMHKRDYLIIHEELSKRGVTEEQVIELIKTKFYHELGPVELDYASNITTKDFSSFEKVLCLRESEKCRNDSVSFDEVSNIVHLNDAFTICLNPYKFNYYSPYISKLIMDLG
jgi:ABC-type lipoprotein export system ATPase subunit